MRECDKERTAFATSLGLMQLNVMPFGMMRLLLNKPPNVDNYIDDVLVHTVTWSEHLASLRGLFMRIREAGLTVKPSKCCAGQSSVSFVGHQIKQGKLQTRTEFINKIKNAKLPVTIKEVRSFLGLTGYYRRFVSSYADIAAPLVELTKKGKPNKIVWNGEAKHSFEKLQALLCCAPVLRLPDLARPFVLRTDASEKALGAVLLQSYDDMFFPVAYANKTLISNHAQQAYSVVEKECLSIIWSLEKYYPYLYGNKFISQSDHQPLAYLQTAKLSNNRLMRWAIKLQPYSFTVETIPGKRNFGADFLSRCEMWYSPGIRERAVH